MCCDKGVVKAKFQTYKMAKKVMQCSMKLIMNFPLLCVEHLTLTDLQFWLLFLSNLAQSYGQNRVSHESARKTKHPSIFSKLWIRLMRLQRSLQPQCMMWITQEEQIPSCAMLAVSWQSSTTTRPCWRATMLPWLSSSPPAMANAISSKTWRGELNPQGPCLPKYISHFLLCNIRPTSILEEGSAWWRTVHAPVKFASKRVECFCLSCKDFPAVRFFSP